MWVFLLRRALSVPPLLLAVSFLTHCLLSAAPGDYFSRLAEDPAISAEYMDALRTKFGLEGGLFERYWRWLIHAVQLDFGFSFRFDLPVFEVVWERLGNTLLLSVAALVVAWGLALPLGVLAAAYQDTWIDRLIGLVSFVGLSIPRVFLALLAVMFAAMTQWFPTGGMRNQIHWDSFTATERLLNVAHHLVLPALVIGLTQMAAYMRQMRGEMVETLGKDYIRTARAKGVGPWSVLFKHAFGNAINPLITLFGYSLAALLTGSFLVEVVFSWPGLARLTVDAVFAQDEPLVMATVMMATGMLVVGNLVADVLLALVDPRVRLS